MRVCGLLLAVTLGLIQFAVDAALGAAAATPSVPRALHAIFGDGPLVALALHGAPWLAAAAAQAALDASAPDRAQALLPLVASANRRASLAARIALARGDVATAVRVALGAGDVATVETAVERLHARDDYRAARTLQRALVEALRERSADRDVQARALWRLATLDAEAGYREPPRRPVDWRQALDDDGAALALVPLSETYLLAAGNQALLDGERAEAAEFFRRVLALDAASVAARSGLRRALTGICAGSPFRAPGEPGGPCVDAR